jgi:protocatechuate 3,4-dioxygenase beta subunit
MGIVTSVSLGDLVWYDANRDGVYDEATETGVADVAVRLLDADGNPVKDADGMDVGTTPTDEFGRYLFSNLIVGTYKVEFTLPDGYRWTKPNVLTLGDTLDSDVTFTNTDDATAMTGTRFVSALAPVTDTDPSMHRRTATDPSFDAGIWYPFALGDIVWYDLDRNGQQDTGEKPVVGAVAHLLMDDGTGTFIDAKNADGAKVADYTTKANGLYVFDNLLPGKYKVVFTHNQANYLWTAPNAIPLVDAIDSDAVFATANSDATASTGVIDIGVGLGNTRPIMGADATTYGAIIAAFIDPTNDAGIWTPLAVGNYVWNDVNHDGIQGDPAAEPPVENVVVTLLDKNGNPAKDADGNDVAPTKTDATGFYVFANLLPGEYTIQFSDWPDGYAPTVKSSTGSTLTNDSNPDTTGLTPVFTLAPTGGQMVPNTDPAITASAINPTIDMGIFRAVSLGDVVWYDSNRDGIFDPDAENGVEGVAVHLLHGDGTPVLVGGAPLTTTTDADGRYSFTNLASLEYIVQFVLPNGYEWTKSNVETSGDLLDSDVIYDSTTQLSAKTAKKLVTDIAPVTDDDTSATARNVTDPGFDAGIWIPLAIGDYVWFDLNRNGVQDAGEKQVPNVTVELFGANGTDAVTDADGDPVGSTMTDENGLYLFDNLLPGEYVVKFTHAEADYRWTNPNAAGVTDATDSDAIATSDTVAATVVISLAFDSTNVVPTADNGVDYGKPMRATFIDPTNDAGIWMPVAVGDYVWFDTNHDGVQALTGEDPVADVTVTLTDKNGNPVKDADGNDVVPTQTDSAGWYVFDNLLPGEYKITFSTLPAGAVPTTQAAGTDDGLDSNPDPTTLMTPVFTLAPSGGNMVANTKADVTAPMIDPTIDMGIWIPVSIGDYVWYDIDHDGVQETGEAPIGGVKVTLLDKDGNPVTDADGAVVATATTDAKGHYVFDNLLPGEYRVKFVAAVGYIPTLQAAGADGAIDSNPDATGVTPVFTVAADGTLVRDTVAADGTTVATRIDPTIDAGFWAPLAVGNYVWFDLDHDGVQEAGEKPVEGVTVELLNADGTPATDANGDPVPAATTDASGHYVFDNLIGGQYKVKFSNLPAGYEFTKQAGTSAAGDSNPDTTGVSAVFTLSVTSANVRAVEATDGTTAATMIDPTIDAGIWMPLAIGDYVWFDNNADGIQDSDEDPIADVTVELLDKDGKVLATTTTDADGHYVFDGLAAGDYKLRFGGWPVGYELTRTGSGTDANDSNPDPTTHTTELITLAPNAENTRDVTAADGTAKAAQINPTIDAGIWQPLAVGTKVWIDTDKDGVQDANEPGIAGVTVKLFNSDGTPVVDGYGKPVAAVTTDANGNYLFDNLLPGEYYMEFTPPSGYTFTDQGAAAGGSTGDSNAGTTGRTPIFELKTTAPNVKPGTTADGTHLVDITIDAGLVKKTAGTGGSGTKPPTTKPPVTGASPLPFVLFGAALVGIGVLLTFVNRRRRGLIRL